MRLLILDPNLTDRNGHHLGYDIAIAREARRRGMACEIFSNKQFGEHRVEGVRIRPHFTRTCYWPAPDRAVTGAYDTFHEANELLYRELSWLPHEAFDARTLVLAPTVTENHLYGLVRWMKAWSSASPPSFCVFLMLPSGLAFGGPDDAEPEIVNEQQALYYTLAFREAARSGPPIAFFASSAEHAREFSWLAERPIPAHPVLLTTPPPPPSRAAPSSARALLYAGDAKASKGFALVPEIAAQLCAARPDWTFVVHANLAPAYGLLLDRADELAELQASQPNFEFRTGYLDEVEYAELLQSGDVIVTPYDPVEYKRKSSGVLWEALYYDKIAVGPAGTWLEREAQRWGAAAVTFAAFEPSAIADAVLAAIVRRPALQAQAQAAGQAFRRRNGATALMDAVLAAHGEALVLAGGAGPASSIELDLADPTWPGWHPPELLDGKLVRWTKAEAQFEAPASDRAGCRLVIAGMSHAGEDLVRGMTVTMDGAPLEGASLQLGGHRWGYAAAIPAAAPTADNEPARSRRFVITVPEARATASDPREMGLLVASIHLAPPGADVLRQAELPSGASLAVFVRGAYLMRALGDRLVYDLGEAAAAECLASPLHHASLGLSVVGAPSPEAAFHLRCRINGEEAAPKVAKTQLNDDWGVQFIIHRDVIARQSGKLTLEFYFANPDALALDQGWRYATVTRPYLTPFGT